MNVALYALLSCTQQSVYKKWTGIEGQNKSSVIKSKQNEVNSAQIPVQSLFFVAVFRGGAGTGGEATLAVQRIPAGAERVPAAETQGTQVPLRRYVSCTWMGNREVEQKRQE